MSMRSKPMLRVALCGVLCLAVVGACATMAKPTPEQVYMRHRAVLKLAVQIGVIEFLHRQKALAPLLADIAGAVRDELVGEAHPLDFLREALQHKMASAQVGTAEQLLIMNLMDVLVQTMREYFLEQDVISTQILVRVSEIAGWIAEAAHMKVAS